MKKVALACFVLSFLLVGCSNNDDGYDPFGSTAEEKAKSEETALSKKTSASSESYVEETKADKSEDSSEKAVLENDETQISTTTRKSPKEDIEYKLDIFKTLNVDDRSSLNEKDGKTFILVSVNRNNQDVDVDLTPQIVQIEISGFSEQNNLIGVDVFKSGELFETNNDLRVAIIDKKANLIDSVNENEKKEIDFSESGFYYIRVNSGGVYDLSETGLLIYRK